MANDRISTSLTFVMNLGGYQSAHIQAGVETDVREGENIREAFKRAESLVDERIAEQASNIRASFKKEDD